MPEHSNNNSSFKSPMRFELPPQSSSSEDESSNSEKEEEFCSNHAEEKCNGNAIDDNSIGNHNGNGISVSEGMTIAKATEYTFCAHGEAKQQEAMSGHEIRRPPQEQAAGRLANQSDRELFEAAFDGCDYSYARKTARGEPTPAEKGSRAGALMEENHLEETLPSASQQEQEQICIDLVDSDDDELGQQTQNSRSYDNHEHNNHQHRLAARNEVVRRSPNRMRSPMFNIAARNFIHKDSRSTTAKHPDREIEEVDDVYQFEDDDNRSKGRPRRVTQDHTNHITCHNNIANASATNERSRFHGEDTPNPYRNAESNRQTQTPGHRQQVRGRQIQRLSSGGSNIPRPWSSGVRRTGRRLRDPIAGNPSLAASVGSKNGTRGGFTAAAASIRNQATPRSTQQRQNSSIGDIRTFVSRRPGLANETRNRMKSIESVRANRHDIQGHANVTVIHHQSSPEADGRRTRSRSRNVAEREAEEEQDDVIEIYDDDEEEEERSSATGSTRTRRAATAAKPRAKPKRKPTVARKAKPRKTRGRRGRRAGGRGGGRYTRRGRKNGAAGNDDSGAWGSTGGGWASARPVHREDPAFRNVGAEITF